MTKKLIIITGSALIGLISMLAIIFTMIATEAIEVEQKTIVFSSASAEIVYSGEALCAKEWEITSGELKEGHSARVIVSGQQTTVGSSLNAISATIVDENGADVTEYYKIEYQPGTLNVFHRSLQVLANTASKVYDGTPLTCQQYTIAAGELPAGHIIVPSYPDSITDVGTVANNVSVAIHDASGTDITANYNILTISGSLTVTKRPIYFQSKSLEKVYDGTPLTNGENTYDILSGELVFGHTVDAVYSGSITNAGSTINELAVTINDENGRNLTDNYNISVTNGTLTVIKRALEYQSGSFEKTYDGAPMSFTTDAPNTATLINGELAAGHYAVITMLKSIVDAGNVSNEFSVVILDSNNNDNDVTANYTITSHFGTLTVSSVRISISTNSDRKEFDGTPLTSYGVYYTGTGTFIESGVTEIIPGFRLFYGMTGTQTEAGESSNTFTYYIADVNGTDLTKNFVIDVQCGTLTVTPIRLTVKSNDVTEFYKDEIISGKISDCSLINGEILDNHNIEFIPLVSVIDVCSTKNIFHVVITDNEGADVTANYEITYVYGNFTILPRVIRIITHSANHIYDGQPFSYHEYTVDPTDALLEGHCISYISFSPNSTIVNVGTVKNSISSVVIQNALGDDVTRNYLIDCSDEGDIIVTPRPITIRTADASKNYDGTPLTDERWYVVSLTKPLETHNLEVAVSGTRTEVGEVPNYIAEVRITDTETNKNVTSNYAITEQLGALIVKGNNAGGSTPLPDGGESAGPIEDGGGLGGDNTNDDSVCIRLYSEKSGQVKLRYKSFGDFDPTSKSWTEAASYNKLLDGKYSYNYLSGIALQNAGVDSIRLDVENLIGTQYFLPYFPDTYDANYDIQTSDVVYVGDASDIYSLYYYLYSGDFSEITPNLGEYSDEELEYREYVYKNYLYVDENLRDYMVKVITTNGFDPDSNTIILDVASYIQTAANYNLDYNKAIDYAVHPIIAFLTEQEGVCRHYASAATALFRTLGIPARYVIGFAGETRAAEWSEITGKQAHAWTEVYIDGIGWIPVEVTGSSNDGSGNGNGNGNGSGNGSGNNGSDQEQTRAIKVKPKTTYHKYDGNVHYPKNEVDGLSGLLSNGFTYSATVEKVGTATNLPGVYESKITSFILYDNAGNDVTSQYKIEFSTGHMQIYLKELTVRTYGSSKVYDGTALTCDGYTVEGDLLSNHTISSLVCTGQQINVGKSTNNFSISIVDENGSNVTTYYKINRVCATLTVTARTITVTANSATKSYDGEALIDKGYTVDGELEGYTVQATVSGSQTKIGYSDNLVQKVIVKDGLGRDVTTNFSVICINGKLYVTPPTN